MPRFFKKCSSCKAILSKSQKLRTEKGAHDPLIKNIKKYLPIYLFIVIVSLACLAWAGYYGYQKYAANKKVVGLENEQQEDTLSDSDKSSGQILNEDNIISTLNSERKRKGIAGVKKDVVLNKFANSILQKAIKDNTMDTEDAFNYYIDRGEWKSKYSYLLSSGVISTLADINDNANAIVLMLISGNAPQFLEAKYDHIGVAINSNKTRTVVVLGDSRNGSSGGNSKKNSDFSTYVFPKLISASLRPTTIYTYGDYVTVSWSSKNTTRAELSCAGQGTMSVPTSGSRQIYVYRTFTTKSLCHIEVYNNDNVSDGKLLYFNIIDAPPAPVGLCQYSAGADAVGTVCKNYSECLGLPGGTWLNIPCN